jgi:hypothetical protein
MGAAIDSEEYYHAFSWFYVSSVKDIKEDGFVTS